MPQSTSNFELPSPDVVSHILKILTPREIEKARLTSKVFNEAYGMLQAKNFTSRELLEKFIKAAANTSLNSIMLEYLSSLAFELGEQQDFRAYLLATPPDLWNQLRIKPTAIITTL